MQKVALYIVGQLSNLELKLIIFDSMFWLILGVFQIFFLAENIILRLYFYENPHQV